MPVGDSLLAVQGMVLSQVGADDREEFFKVMDAPMEGVTPEDVAEAYAVAEDDEMLAMLGISREEAVRQASMHNRTNE